MASGRTCDAWANMGRKGCGGNQRKFTGKLGDNAWDGAYGFRGTGVDMGVGSPFFCPPSSEGSTKAPTEASAGASARALSDDRQSSLRI